MKLGITTDTLDITGEIIETGDCSNVTEKAVTEAFKAYTGHVMQVPPKYSALKIDGKRAYDLAREGKDFEIKAREIVIYKNAVTRLDLEAGEIEFDVSCSKGTYIRTICDDIGKALGCGAVMTALTRTASGFFRIADAHTIEEIAEAYEKGEEALDKIIIPADITLEKLGKVLLNDNRITAFMNGNSSWSNGFRIMKPSFFGELYRVYGKKDFLGVAEVENGSLIPKKVIK
jgi:tRNA pseudouridine55 synthase